MPPITAQWLSKSKRHLTEFNVVTTGSILLAGLSRRKSDRDADTDCCKTYLLLHNVLTLLSRKATLYFNRILEGPAAGGGSGDSTQFPLAVSPHRPQFLLARARSLSLSLSLSRSLTRSLAHRTRARARALSLSILFAPPPAPPPTTTIHTHVLP